MSRSPRKLAVSIAGGALLVAAVAVAPLLAPNQFVVRMMVTAGISCLVVLGVNLIFGYAGQVSLGHAAFFGIGAYTTAILTTRYGWPPAAGIVAAVIVATAAAYLVGLPALRLKGHYLAMATLGFNEIVVIVLVEAKPLTGGSDGLGGIPSLSIAGFDFTSHTHYYYLVWALVLVGLLIARNLVRSRAGRAVRALHDSETAASASSVDVASFKIRTFAISAAYAGIAGAIYAHFLTFITPSAFFVAASVIFLAMVIGGGMGTLLGPIIGGILLTVGPELLRTYQDYTLMVYGGLLIVTMMFFPGGIASLWRKWVRT